MPTRGSEADVPSGLQPGFGASGRWPPARAAAAVIAILLGAAVVATAISSLMPWTDAPRSAAGRGSPVHGLAGLSWLLAFQCALIVQTLLAASAYRGEARRVLCLAPPEKPGRTVLAAVLALFPFAATYAAIVFALDRAALIRDLAPAAALARSDVWIVALAAIGIGAPLAEELLFRGFLFPALARSRLGLWGAAVVSTLAWTALHAGYSLYGLVEVFLVGLFFCWLLVRSGSLWVPIFCHAIYNTVIVLGLRWLPIPL